MKHLKQAVFLILAALMALALGSCASNGEPDGPDLDVEDMVQAMMEVDTTLPEEMIVHSGKGTGGEDSFFYLSDLDYSKVEAYCYTFADAGTAEEIAVVKLKDKSDAAALMDSLHKHVEARQGTFEEYDPEQVPLTESAVVTSEGRYVTLIVSKKNGLVQSEFKKFFAAN